MNIQEAHKSPDTCMVAVLFKNGFFIFFLITIIIQLTWSLRSIFVIVLGGRPLHSSPPLQTLLSSHRPYYPHCVSLYLTNYFPLPTVLPLILNMIITINNFHREIILGVRFVQLLGHAPNYGIQKQI